MDAMTFNQFSEFVSEVTGERPSGIRFGQWAYTVLHQHHPRIADSICGTQVDPFYDDERVPALLCLLLDRNVKD